MIKMASTKEVKQMNKRSFKNRLVQLENHLTKLRNEVRSIIGDIDRDLDQQSKLKEGE